MGWAVGYDDKWKRDIGYGVPAICDHPECSKEIHRGLSYVCGTYPSGGEHGCGLFFCDAHLLYTEIDDECPQLCERCTTQSEQEPFNPKPDTEEWINHKENHESWAAWRAERDLEASDH